MDNIMFILIFMFCKKLFDKYVKAHKCKYEYFHYCIGIKMRQKYIQVYGDFLSLNDKLIR